MKPCECGHEIVNHEDQKSDEFDPVTNQNVVTKVCNIPGCECQDFKEQKQGAKANEKIDDDTKNQDLSGAGDGDPSDGGDKPRAKKSKKA